MNASNCYLNGRNRYTTWVKVLNPNYLQRAGSDEVVQEAIRPGGIRSLMRIRRNWRHICQL
jgi:hypothetical protein